MGDLAVDVGMTVLPVKEYNPLIDDLMRKEDEMHRVKVEFEDKLRSAVNLRRVSCPIFLDSTSGFNDNLNGVEKPASFSPGQAKHKVMEMPFSLAKWKRWALWYYNAQPGMGIVTDMRGVRSDDDIDYKHSLYVDQWDWEKRIGKADRTPETLEETVKAIYKAIRDTEIDVGKRLGYEPSLPEEIVFYSTEDAIKQMPDASPHDRERALCERYGAVFLMGISDERHDGRAPDYDDWTTPRNDGGLGLNGDILVWHPVLKEAFELSSMGIRVDTDALTKQLAICNVTERLKLPWHMMLADGTLPNSIGGGIGQSRLMMFMLRCAHIGEVHHSWWAPEMVTYCKSRNVHILGPDL